MAIILVIEDEEGIRENLLELLEAENFQGVGATNGKMGVELALQYQPDLIVCDVMMPEMNGHQVLQHLRANPATATIPFIFLTARSDKSDLRQGMEFGADDYLTKPCTHTEFLQAIKTRLEKYAVIKAGSEKQLEQLRLNLATALPHEMRTPLNGILGYSDLLLMELNDLSRDEIRDMVLNIKESGQRLYRMIQNFLLYAELELIMTQSKRIEALQSYRIFSASSVIQDQVMRQAEQSKRKGDLQLNLQDSSLSISVTYLVKIIEELLDNAFKFSVAGTPVIVSSLILGGDFILSVQDFGRGMTLEQINHVGAYMQFERKLYEQQGSGLGLSLAKRLVELHGGKLLLKSKVDQGTVVQVIFPTLQGD